MGVQLAIVLPTLNERANLGSLVERLDGALGSVAWEAIIVDDNSPDGTADEARAMSQRDPRIRVIQRIGRRGLASAAIEGMLATAAPVVAVMDADHQHDPKLLPQMLEAVESGATHSKHPSMHPRQGFVSNKRQSSPPFAAPLPKGLASPLRNC